MGDVAAVGFFNPTVTNLRGLQQATPLAKGQGRLGSRRTSLGALSNAAYMCDATLLHEVIVALGAALDPYVLVAEQEALRHLTAVDGGLLPARPLLYAPHGGGLLCPDTGCRSSVARPGAHGDRDCR